jgi:hypothetical protein
LCCQLFSHSQIDFLVKIFIHFRNSFRSKSHCCNSLNSSYFNILDHTRFAAYCIAVTIFYLVENKEQFRYNQRTSAGLQAST